MIFKTINSDAKSLTEQLGLLNKSFKDIKKDFSNGLGLKNSLFQTSISKTDLQALQKFNSAINATNDGLTKSQRITKAWNENMTGCSIVAKRMGNDLVTGKKKISDISSAMNTASASTKALTTAMNIFANIGFMLAVTAITKVITELSEAQEKAVQVAQEATDKYNDEISSIEDYKQKLSELHEELNSGNLSYEETKTKRTELMSIQDELIEKFGTEKGAIESVTEAIKGQVDALDDLNEKSYRDWVAKADEQTFWNSLLPWGKSGLDQAIDYMETNQTISINDMQNANLSDDLQKIQKEIDNTIQSKYNLEKEFATFKITGTPEEIKFQLEAIRQDYLDLSKDAFLKNGISSEMWEEYRKEAINSINEVINKFDEGIEKHQNTYQTYLEGMIKYDSEYSDEYATILRKRAELESAESSGNKESIQKARQEFMDAINEGIIASSNNDNVKKYFESLYPELQAEFDDWNFEIAIHTNTDNLADEAKKLGEKYTATDLLGMVNDDSTVIADKAFNSLIDKAIEYGVCTDKSAKEVQKLIDLLVEFGYVQGQIDSGIDTDKTDILSFTEAWESLKNTTDEATKGLANDLLEMAQQGRLTAQTLLELDSTDYFKNLGISAEEAVNKINALTDSSTQLNSLSDQIAKMSDMLADKSKGITAGADDLAGFDVEIRGLESWAEFEKVLGDSTSSMEECQKAANALATEWINNGNFLANLTEENKQYYITQLDMMGVQNAEEIVMSRLSTETEALALQRQFATQIGYELVDATASEVAAFLDEAGASETARLYLFKLVTQEQVFNNQDLSVQERINKLKELATAYGQTAIAAKIAATEAAAEAGHTQTSWSEADLLHFQEQVNDAINNVNVSIKPTGSSDYKSSSSKSKSEKDTTKEFDWIENAIASLEKRIKSLQKVIDSSFSTTETKSQALVEQIDLINQEIELQQKAYEAYMAKAESVGLSDKYKNLIQNGDLNIEDITDEELQKAISKYQDYYDKAQETQDKITDLREDNLQTYVDLYDLKADEINKIRDNGGMTEKEYLDKMTKLWKTFFNKQVDYATVAKNKKLDLLEDEKDYLESVVSAATNLLDDEIDSIEKAKDNATKGYKSEIKVLEDKIKVVEEQQEALENQISLIEEQKNAQQEILNNLEKERTKQNEILDVEKTRYNLKRAENQNTVKQYQGGQMIYTTDSNEIKNARQELDDAEFALTKRGIQDVIDQYDKQIDNINKQIDGLDKVIDGYNKQIDALNDLIDKSDAYYDGQITNLENIKSEWEKLLEIEQRATDMKNFTDMFGEGSIAKLLTGDMSMLTQWKDTYASTLAEIDLTTQDKIGSITEKFAELAGVDLSKVTSQFSDLNIAVENTSSAIDGTTAVGNDGQVSQAGNSLVDAMNESYNVASDKIPAETELMNDLTDSVHETSSAIAGGGSSNGKDKKKSESSDSLVGAMDESYNKATDTIPAETDMMSELKDTTIQAKDEVVRLGEEINNLPDEKVIKIKIETDGSMPNGFANGTVGNAFASGTHYKGLAHDEKNALRSEYGQPELTVYPNGKAELTTEPTMSDLPKDTVIYNEEQTRKIMNNKPESVSTAYEGGTVKKVGLPSYLRPIQEGDPWFDLVQKVEANRDKLVGTLVPPVTAIEKNLEMMARNINNVNNNSNMASYSVGEVHIHCPGVTKDEVAKQIGDEVGKMFFGMENNARQRASITR